MSTLAIRHHRYGPPEEVVQLDTLELGPLANDDVRIAMRYSPINPADLNMIEGQYLEQPPLPSVLGNEGVGIIEEIGKNISGTGMDTNVVGRMWLPGIKEPTSPGIARIAAPWLLRCACKAWGLMWFESCWLQGWLVSQCVFCTLLHLRCNAACKGWRVEVNEIELAACKTLASIFRIPTPTSGTSQVAVYIEIRYSI